MGESKRLRLEEAPAVVRALIDRLVPLLIEGDDPVLAILREQLPHLRTACVEWTGGGFYAEFELPDTVPLTTPLKFAGGDAVIALTGQAHPAGCVLFIENGRLALLDVFSCAGDAWASDAEVVSIEDVIPVYPGPPPNGWISRPS